MSRDSRRAKTRETIRGTAGIPRLLVFRSNKYFYAQLVDDAAGKTMVSVDRVAGAEEAGKKLAEKAVKAKISTVIFDRAGYRYHGNIKKLADAAREGGLKF